MNDKTLRFFYDSDVDAYVCLDNDEIELCAHGVFRLWPDCDPEDGAIGDDGRPDDLVLRVSDTRGVGMLEVQATEVGKWIGYIQIRMLDYPGIFINIDRDVLDYMVELDIISSLDQPFYIERIIE